MRTRLLPFLVGLLMLVSFGPQRADAVTNDIISACNITVGYPHYSSADGQVQARFTIGCPSAVKFGYTVKLFEQVNNLPDDLISTRHATGLRIGSAGTLTKTCGRWHSYGHYYYVRATFTDQYGNKRSFHTAVVYLAIRC